MSDNSSQDNKTTLVTPPPESDIDTLRLHLAPKYTVEKKLGSGGMADVYLGFHTQLKRKVAIKVLPRMFSRDQAMVGRFLQEAESAAQLEHPNIISIYDIGKAGPLNYFIMAYISGGSLKDKLIQKGTIDVQTACRYIIQICQALQYAHHKGVIHRDIKPDNIMFDERGNAILTDFGIAKAKFASKMTATGTLIGTPHYMSPEQLKGQAVDGRSDIYSLGIMFYEMLTGRVPFEGEDTYSIGLKHIQEPPVPPLTLNNKIPRPVNNVILSMLAKTGDARFQSAEEVAEALAATLVEEKSPTSKTIRQLEMINSRAATAIESWQPHGQGVEADSRKMQETLFPGQSADQVQSTKKTAKAAGQERKFDKPASAQKRGKLPLVIGLVAVVAIIVGAVIIFSIMSRKSESGPVQPAGGDRTLSADSYFDNYNLLYYVRNTATNDQGSAIAVKRLEKPKGDPVGYFDDRPQLIEETTDVAFSPATQRFLLAEKDGTLITVNSFGWEDIVLYNDTDEQIDHSQPPVSSPDKALVAFVTRNSSGFRLKVAEISEIGTLESEVNALSSQMPIINPQFIAGEERSIAYGIYNQAENATKIWSHNLQYGDNDLLVEAEGKLVCFAIAANDEMVACLFNQSDENQLKLYDLDKKTNRTLMTEKNIVGRLIFSPDDEFIYYCTGPSDGSFDIWSIDKNGGEPRKITNLNSSDELIPLNWIKKQ